jgi:mRNA interferase RelE/StbE
MTDMKTILFTDEAARDLNRYAGQSKRIISKLKAYASTGAGDVKVLSGVEGSRLRVGSYRAVFIESESEIMVIKIGPRGSVYE